MQRSERWREISREVYWRIRHRHVESAWHVFASVTNVKEERYMTDWGLVDAAEPLLRFEFEAGQAKWFVDIQEAPGA